MIEKVNDYKTTDFKDRQVVERIRMLNDWALHEVDKYIGKEELTDYEKGYLKAVHTISEKVESSSHWDDTRFELSNNFAETEKEILADLPDIPEVVLEHIKRELVWGSSLFTAIWSPTLDANDGDEEMSRVAKWLALKENQDKFAKVWVEVDARGNIADGYYFVRKQKGL